MLRCLYSLLLFMSEKKLFQRTKFYIFFSFLIIFFTKFSATYLYANNYKIQNLEISAPYEIDFDKQNIIDSAFVLAFKELIEKITISDEGSALYKKDLNLIKSLIDSFTIVDEKFIDNKYIAKFYVNFNKKQVLDFLEKENIFPSIPIEKTLFVMPVLIDLQKNQLFLFSENPFYLNWNNNNEKHYLLKYIVPNEDIEDINFLKKNINNIEDYNFNEIISKYDLNDYIIIILFKNNKNLKILSKLNFNNDQIIFNDFFSEVNFDEKESLEKVIKELKTNYENQWKKINQINTSIKLTLTISLDSKNIKLIEKFEKEISNLDLVSHYYIDYFSNENTIYKIIYNSTPKKFIEEIEKIGMNVDNSSKIWIVQ